MCINSQAIYCSRISNVLFTQDLAKKLNHCILHDNIAKSLSNNVTQGFSINKLQKAVVSL